MKWMYAHTKNQKPYISIWGTRAQSFLSIFKYTLSQIWGSQGSEECNCLWSCDISYIVSYMCTDISGKPAASIIMVNKQIN